MPEPGGGHPGPDPDLGQDLDGDLDRDPGRDPDRIRAMFNDVAPDYDRVNRVISLRLAHRWRRALLEAVDPDPDARVVDLGAGTGDLSLEAAHRVPEGGVMGVDLSEEMLARAQEKASEGGETAARLSLVQGTALRLPLPPGAADAVVSAYTLRNVRDLDRLAREARRLLRPGGTFASLEIYGGGPSLLGRVAGGLFHALAPRVGRALSGHPDAYRYLSASVEEFPPPSDVTGILEDAGFEEARWRPHLGGVVGVHVARAP